MKTTAATERNFPLIVETIITSHTGIVYYLEHNAEGTPPHHGFSLLISVECTCVEHYPCVYCRLLGEISGITFHTEQGSPTFLKLRATSCLAINANGNYFDTHF